MTPFFSSHYEEILCLLEEERARVVAALKAGEGSISARCRSVAMRPSALPLLHVSDDSARGEGDFRQTAPHVPSRAENNLDDAA